MGFFKTAGIGLGALFLVGACLGGTDDDADTDKKASGASKGDSEVKVKAKAEDDGNSAADKSSDPTQQDVWRDNYDDGDKRIKEVLAKRLPAYKQPMDASNESLATCNEIASGRPLKKRLNSAGIRWSADPAQALVVVTVVAENICPNVAKTHTKQVKQKRKADARAEARRRAAEAVRAERERQAQVPQPVSYANCSAVEAAGAAPIYVGDPGYSSDLDRDGDGVACEQ